MEKIKIPQAIKDLICSDSEEDMLLGYELWYRENPDIFYFQSLKEVEDHYLPMEILNLIRDILKESNKEKDNELSRLIRRMTKLRAFMEQNDTKWRTIIREKLTKE